MPRLRHSHHLIDLANSDLSNNMTQRLHELNGSSVINLLNVKLICEIGGTYEVFRFAYHDNALYRHINGARESCSIPQMDAMFGSGDLAVMAWEFVTDIELDDDTLVFYQS